MTKAQMQAALDTARLENEELEDMLTSAQNALAREQRKLDGLHAWPCPNSEGTPVCVTSDDDDPNGFSVNMYRVGREGTVVGVAVHGKMTGDLVAAAGMVPADLLGDVAEQASR